MTVLHNISIVVPAYNSKDVIEECIKSILNVNYPEELYEAIIVDNNSTDCTAEIIKKYPVKYVFEERKGSYAARNTGAKHARGDILAFTDADCIVDKNWLKEINETLRDGDIDGVIGFSGGINKNLWAELMQKRYERVINDFTNIEYLQRIDTRNFAIKQDIFIKAGTFNENLLHWGDAEFGAILYSLGYRIVFNKNVKVLHKNLTSIIKIVNTAKNQGFYAFQINRYHSHGFMMKYFPHLINNSNRNVEKKMQIIFRLSKSKYIDILGKFTKMPKIYLRGLKTIMEIIIDNAFWIGYIQGQNITKKMTDTSWNYKDHLKNICTNYISQNKKMIPYPKVSIIILNWNGWKDTIECLESLYQITYPNYDVIVVDNGSEDESIEKIKEYTEGKIKAESKFFEYNSSKKPIKYIEYTREEAEIGGEKEKKIANLPSNKKLIIIKNKKNYGFAKGNNIAMKVALKDKYVKYIALLNNDTKVESYWLEELVKVAESDEQVGSCQSKILSMSNPWIVDAVGISITRSGGAIQDGYKTRDIGQYNQVKEIFGVCAGAALYRREMLTQIGLFDEDFFAYYEDVDLALRARLAGWKSMYVPESVVYHIHSSTLGKNSPFKLYFLTRNEYYYKIKNLPTSILIKFLMIQPRAIALRILGFIKNKEFQLVRPYLRGNYNALKNIPKMLKKRKKIQSTRLIQDEEMRGWFE